MSRHRMCSRGQYTKSSVLPAVSEDFLGGMVLVSPRLIIGGDDKKPLAGRIASEKFHGLTQCTAIRRFLEGGDWFSTEG